MVSALEGFHCIGWLTPVHGGGGGNFLEAKLDVYTRVTFNYPKAGVSGFYYSNYITREEA